GGEERDRAEMESTTGWGPRRSEDLAVLRPEEEREVGFALWGGNVETRHRQVGGHGQARGGIPFRRHRQRGEVLRTEPCPDRGRNFRRLSQLVDRLLGDLAAGECNRELVTRGTSSARPELRDRREDQTEAVS